jgi:hypothetical protein
LRGFCLKFQRFSDFERAPENALIYQGKLGFFKIFDQNMTQNMTLFEGLKMLVFQGFPKYLKE